MTEKKKQGLAAISPEKRREIQAKGREASARKRLEDAEKLRKYDEMMGGDK